MHFRWNCLWFSNSFSFGRCKLFIFIICIWLSDYFLIWFCFLKVDHVTYFLRYVSMWQWHLWLSYVALLLKIKTKLGWKSELHRALWALRQRSRNQNFCIVSYIRFVLTQVPGVQCPNRQTWCPLRAHARRGSPPASADERPWPCVPLPHISRQWWLQHIVISGSVAKHGYIASIYIYIYI
jgi:hypothetical protein